VRTGRTTMMCLAVLLLAPRAVWAQETSNARTLPIPVKVTVVFKEYEGGKLVNNLPYILSVNAGQSGFGPDEAHLRMGLNVPISFGSRIEYRDVGTNIDCGVKTEGGGRYLVSVAATRESVHQIAGAAKRASAAGEDPAQSLSLGPAVGGSPIFDNSSMNENLLMRDNQTIQSLMATDPVTGRVLKVDVTLNVVR
jgi:hypothetical protein